MTPAEQLTDWARHRLHVLNSDVLSQQDQTAQQQKLALLAEETIKMAELINETNAQLDIDSYTWLGMAYSSVCRFDPQFGQRAAPVISALRTQAKQLGVATRFIVYPYIRQPINSTLPPVTFTNTPQEKVFLKRNFDAIEAYTAIGSTLIEVRQDLSQMNTSGAGTRDLVVSKLQTVLDKLSEVRSVFTTIFDDMTPMFFFGQLVPFYAPVAVDGPPHRPADARDQPGVFCTDIALGVASPQYIERQVQPNLQYLIPEHQSLVRTALASEGGILDAIWVLTGSGKSPKTNSEELAEKLRTTGLTHIAEKVTQICQAHADLGKVHLALVLKFMNNPLEQMKAAPFYPMFRGLMDHSLAHLETLTGMRLNSPKLDALRAALN